MACNDRVEQCIAVKGAKLTKEDKRIIYTREREGEGESEGVKGIEQQQKQQNQSNKRERENRESIFCVLFCPEFMSGYSSDRQTQMKCMSVTPSD